MPLMPVKLTLNKKNVPIREVSELCAVRGEPAGGKGAKKKGRITLSVNGAMVDVPSLPLARVTDLIPGAEHPDLARFQDQGWSFVERAELASAPDAPSSRVLVGKDGRVSLGTHRITVKFKNPDADPEVQLKPYGVKSFTPLKFDKGLYSVLLDTKSGKDALDAAAELTAGGTVEYAEPELLQVFSGR